MNDEYPIVKLIKIWKQIYLKRKIEENSCQVLRYKGIKDGINNLLLNGKPSYFKSKKFCNTDPKCTSDIEQDEKEFENFIFKLMDLKNKNNKEKEVERKKEEEEEKEKKTKKSTRDN